MYSIYGHKSPDVSGKNQGHFQWVWSRYQGFDTDRKSVYQGFDTDRSSSGPPVGGVLEVCCLVLCRGGDYESIGIQGAGWWLADMKATVYCCQQQGIISAPATACWPDPRQDFASSTFH